MDRIMRWIETRLFEVSDTEVERARKLSVIITRPIGIFVALVYSLIFFYYGIFWPTIVAAAFVIFQTINTLIMFKTRRVRGSMILTAIINTGAACLGQITLGGFVQSGGISLIALSAPMLVVLGLGRREGSWTFLAFVIVETVLMIFDPLIRAAAPEVPLVLTHTLAYTNIMVTGIVIYILTYVIALAMDTARSRADSLLLNILPGPIAELLKRNPSTIADGFDEVTVLFADIVDFTTMSAHANPRDVVNMLNDVFSDFDTLAQKHGLEKIKTIGDAYMVAGGLPIERPDHDTAVVEFALDMLKVLETRRAWNDQPIRVRIGINTGSVVAGVIGRHKFIYDLWGDAVNTASRMESHGLGNSIQVTESTYQRLKDRYEFEARGAVNIKGKGDMNTYLLRGRRAGASI